MKLLSVAALAFALSGVAVPALAQNAYGTGVDTPWASSIDPSDPLSPETAMNTAFGAGNWTRTLGFTTAIFTGNSFVYLDGGDEAGIEDFFVNGGGRTALETFVLAGGRAFVNAARNDTFTPFEIGFGLTLTGNIYNDTARLTAAGHHAGFRANGAGRRWTGFSFGHDIVSCEAGKACDGETTVFVVGESGDLVAGGKFGDGYLLVGGQTPPYWQSPEPAAAALRANQLTFVASGGVLAVPEPASWAMLIAGFGLTGAAMRRRRPVLA